MISMARHKMIFVLFLLSLIFLAGCGTGPQGEEGDLYYLRGTEGLQMEFMQGMPPSYIYSGDKLTLGLMLRNKGTAPIDYGRLYIEGYDRSVIPPTGNGPGENLPGREGYSFTIPEHRGIYNDYGGEQFVQFTSGEVRLPLETPIYPLTLSVYACYTYQTKASATICLDPKPHRTNVDKPCITQDVSLGTQGAPVAVSYVDVENIGGDKARLVFTIQNVGVGDIINRDQMNLCPTDLLPSDLNVVNVNAINFVGENGPALSCSNIVNGQVRLGPTGTGKIVCTAPIDASAVSSYLKTVYVELSYGYRQAIKKRLEIRSE